MKQVYANSFVFIISLVAFWTIQHLFDNAYSDQFTYNRPSDIESALTDVSSKPTELDISVESDTFTILKKILDLLLGVLLLYSCILTVVAFFNVFCFSKFDKNVNNFTIPTYSLFFNLFDLLGKLIPPTLLVHNSVLLQTLNLARFIIPGYFYYILFFCVSEVFSSPYFRMLANVVLGITNGYFTSSFFTMGASRFASPVDKGKAIYLSVLFLCLGIVAGAFINILMERSMTMTQ
jgi:hypothetical protein